MGLPNIIAELRSAAFYAISRLNAKSKIKKRAWENQNREGMVKPKPGRKLKKIESPAWADMIQSIIYGASRAISDYQNVLK